MERVLCLLIGYAFGLIQTAYFYGKANGIDIRQHGSGNAGSTNALRVLGKKAGIIVLLGDCLKCMMAIFVSRLLFGESNPDTIYLLSIYAAAGAILGHNFPFYMGFKGGKGIAATGGLILAFHPYFIPVGIVVFFSVFFITHYVSLGSLMVYLFFMIQIIYCGQNGVFVGMNQNNLNEMYFVAFLLAAMAYWKHKDNIIRLLKGEERKTYLSKKNRMD